MRPPSPPTGAAPAAPFDALLALRSRGEIRRGGEWLDAAGPDARAALVAAARKRGRAVPDDWETLDGRRLLRGCLARAEEAQRRVNPIRVDEAFVCTVCAREVAAGGRRPRDHCPSCLHSVHLDVVPGDRAAGCGGLLVPVRVDPSSKGLMIAYRCDRCGIERRNRVLDDIEPPDDVEAIRKLVVQCGRLG